MRKIISAKTWWLFRAQQSERNEEANLPVQGVSSALRPGAQCKRKKLTGKSTENPLEIPFWFCDMSKLPFFLPYSWCRESQVESQVVFQSIFQSIFFLFWIRPLGFVDLDLYVAPSCPADSAEFPSALAELGRQWNSQNPSQPNPGGRPDETPCTVHFLTCFSISLPSRFWFSIHETWFMRTRDSESNQSPESERKPRHAGGKSFAKLLAAFHWGFSRLSLPFGYSKGTTFCFQLGCFSVNPAFSQPLSSDAWIPRIIWYLAASEWGGRV